MFVFNIKQTHALTFKRDSYHRKFIIEMPVKFFQHLSSIDLSRIDVEQQKVGDFFRGPRCVIIRV